MKEDVECKSVHRVQGGPNQMYTHKGLPQLYYSPFIVSMTQTVGRKLKSSFGVECTGTPDRPWSLRPTKVCRHSSPPTRLSLSYRASPRHRRVDSGYESTPLHPSQKGPERQRPLQSFDLNPHFRLNIYNRYQVITTTTTVVIHPVYFV